MTDSASPPRRLGRAARSLLLLLMLVALVWAAVICWWQLTRREVTNVDLALYLLMLPLLLAGTLLLMLRRRARKRTASAPAAAATEVPTQALPVPGLPLLAAWLMTSLGKDATEVLGALEQRRVRPRPDSLLLDAQGFPAMSSRIEDLDCATIGQQLDAVAATAADTSLSGHAQRDAFLRTIAVLGLLLDRILAEWPLPQPSGQTEATRVAALSTLRGASGIPLEPPDPFQLQVKLLMSDTLDNGERQLALLYLEQRLAGLGLPPQQVELELLTAGDDASALGVLEAFRTADGIHALLLLGCESTLCPTIVETWQGQDRLFDSRHPNGMMMGEAGFAVLAVSAAALPRASVAPLCHMSRVARAQRTESADVGGKPNAACLKQQVATALQSASVEKPGVAAVVCDADHRASRTLECIDVMIEHTPALDAVRERVTLNEFCGHLGAASAAGLLALGTQRVAASEQPALLLSLSHPVDRAAVVLLPHPPAPDLQAA